MSTSGHTSGGVSPPQRQSLESAEALPLTVDDITPRWLSGILGFKVNDLKIHEIIHGAGTIILVEVAYSENQGSSKELPPTRLCVKGGFNPQLLEVLPSLFAVYRLEAQFYHHIAPLIPGLRLIPAHWCGTDPPDARGQGLVVMSDIKAAGYAFGDPLRTWPVARVKAGLVQLAKLHARTWGAREAEFPGVPRDFGMRDVITGMMSPENWALRFEDPAVRPPIPEELWGNRERVVSGLQALWANSDRRMVCLVHGDTQIGNTFIDADGQPGFLDWQCVHVNSGVHDVTYFMTGALTISERRAHERDLFGFYLSELHKAGAPKFEVGEVWDEYRKYQLQGFAWALAGPMMQPKEVVDAISQRHCAAIMDHRSLELLESFSGVQSGKRGGQEVRSRL
ncbi:hypothetical protein KVR01_002104 [Diaporthe batatas]|uniref:uncharacterized protein n=1 Tax=Diaporthe batatas TaxID=748121 RepID=UPI001D03B06A|nr:uncharacterized protein KVR01_002104 [Diaporthe batatas]KAG8166415.1 hypothetical protein KVR01_002104 [Diaporthe batatas]